jgi:hypothetical protein
MKREQSLTRSVVNKILVGPRPSRSPSFALDDDFGMPELLVATVVERADDHTRPREILKDLNVMADDTLDCWVRQ